VIRRKEKIIRWDILKTENLYAESAKRRGLTDVPTLYKKDYTPVPGFFDLRNFKLTLSEFRAAWRIQLYLRSVQDRKEHYKAHNPMAWEQALNIGAELSFELTRRLKPDAELT